MSLTKVSTNGKMYASLPNAVSIVKNVLQAAYLVTVLRLI